MWKILYFLFTFQNYEIVDISPTAETFEQEDECSNAMENLIRFICTSNIPLRALDNIFSPKTLYYLNKSFDSPKRESKAEIIKYFAARISNETFNRLTARRNGRKITRC